MHKVWRAFLLILLRSSDSVIAVISPSSPLCSDADDGTQPHPLTSVSLLQIKTALSTKLESHVVQRRRLGRHLLEHRGGLDSENHGLLDEVQQYAELYHREFSQRSMIFYLHVPKAGGTHLCSLGRSNGCRSILPTECQIFERDGAAWMGDDEIQPDQRPKTCAGLSELYTNLTIEGNENYLIAEGLCPNFWNAVVLRDSIPRLISHLSMIHEDIVWHGQFPFITSTPYPPPQVVFDNMPQLSNNFIIRQMLGKDVYALPFGSINETHLEAAKTVLESFDTIFFLEEGNDTKMNTDIYAKLGLSVQSSDQMDRVGSTDMYRQTLNWTSAEYEEVAAANAMDLELLQHAKALERIDQQVFMHYVFSKVSETMLRAPCGYLSK